MVQITRILSTATLAARTCVAVVAGATGVASRIRYIWPADLSTPEALIDVSNLPNAQYPGLTLDVKPGISKVERPDTMNQGLPGRLYTQNDYFVRAQIVPRGIHIDPDRLVYREDNARGELDIAEESFKTEAVIFPESTENARTVIYPTHWHNVTTVTSEKIPASGWIILSGAVAAPTILLSALAVRVLKEHKLIQTKVLMSSFSLDENVSLSENEDDEGPLRFQLVRDDADDWDVRSPSYVTMQHD